MSALKKIVAENEQRYGEEARAKYGDEAVEEANARVLGLNLADYRKAQSFEVQLRREIVAGLTCDDDSDRAGRIADLHASWLKFFWPPECYSVEAHRELAQGYLADERFRQYYDAWAPGATEYLVSAIMRAAR